MKRRKISFLVSGLASALCVSMGTGSCSKTSNAEFGELDRGTFSYKCVDEDEDPVCENLLAPTPDFPTNGIAVGADFSMWFVTKYGPQNDLDTPSIQSPCEDRLERQDKDSIMRLRFLEPGITPLHATSIYDAVIDFIELEGIAINGLMIAKQKDNPQRGTWRDKWENTEGKLILNIGENAMLRVFPVDKDKRVLAGTMLAEYKWNFGDDSIAGLNPIPAQGTVVRLTGLNPGVSTLEVMLEDISFSIDVSVESKDDAGPDSGTIDAGGSI